MWSYQATVIYSKVYYAIKVSNCTFLEIITGVTISYILALNILSG